MVVASLSAAAGVEEALILLLVIASVVAVAARRVGVPYTVGLVVVGLVVGLVSHVPSLRLSSDLVFYVFLPILLFEAGFNLEAGHLLTDWRRVAALAIPGVLVAFALTGIGVHWLGGTSWTVALLFAALIAATDPVSVVSLFRRLGVPERLTTMIDAESLFNDGTAAVVFAIVLSGVLGGHASVAGAAVRFVWMTAGGLVVGLAVGYSASFIHRHLDDHLIEITLSTIVAYGSFLLGQWLGKEDPYCERIARICYAYEEGTEWERDWFRLLASQVGNAGVDVLERLAFDQPHTQEDRLRIHEQAGAASFCAIKGSASANSRCSSSRINRSGESPKIRK